MSEEKKTKKPTIKKIPKEEKITIEFSSETYNEDDVTTCMEKQTPFEFRTISKKGTDVFVLKVDKPDDPEDAVFYNKESISGTIDACIDKYRQARLAKERTRRCSLRELDGRFFVHVPKHNASWQYDNSDDSGEEDYELFL